MPESPTDLRVGLVTTWGTSCGIATYSAELAGALRPLVGDLVILAEADSGLFGASSYDVRDRGDCVDVCWARRQPQGNAAAIGAVIERRKLNVLHIQHEFGLWPNDTVLAETLREATARGAHTVVTLHTVLPFGGHHRSGTLQMLKQRANVVTTHGRQAQATLLAAGVRAKLVPHGTPHGAAGDRDAGLAFFGVPSSLKTDVRWGLVLGFQTAGKNVVQTLRSFALARATRQLSNCGLLIAGEIKDESYAQRINAVAMEGGYLSALYKRDSFVSPQQVAHIFAAADFGVLNHIGSDPALLSASGQAHLYAAHGCPLACADAPIYGDAFNAGFAIPFQTGHDTEAPTLSAANAIAALAGNAELRAELSANARAYAERTSWPRVAEQLAALYAEVLSA